MVKIFFNNRKIILSDTLSDYSLIHKTTFTNKGDLRDLVHSFEKNIAKESLYIVHSDLVELQNAFFSCFSQLEASGGMVKNWSDNYLFIYRMDKWDLPKGKREVGESIEQNAMREIAEETGVSLAKLSIKKELSPTYHTYQHKGELILKKTNWFLMDYSGNETLIPQTEEHISKVCWLGAADFKMVLENTYESIKEVIAEVGAFL